MAYDKRKRKTVSEHSAASDSPVKFEGQHKFINPYLNDQDKRWLDDNVGTYDDCVAASIGFPSQQYTLRLGYDWGSKRYTAMLTCMVLDHPNTGLILSIRAATCADALYALYYLHHIKAKGVWGNITPEALAPSRWG